MALTVQARKKVVVGGLAHVAGLLTFDNSYASGGESFTASDVGMLNFDIVLVTPVVGGYAFEWDDGNNKILAYFIGALAGNTTPTTAWTVTDDDSAATNGVAVYVHVEETVVEEALQIGHLEFVSPTNADGVETQNSTDLNILDDDAAATGGTALFVAPAGAGLFSNCGADTRIVLEDGSELLVTADADPATNQSAVQVYFDEDGTVGSRLLAVVADNANEPVTVDQEAAEGTPTVAEALTEVTAATDLSAITVPFLAIGEQDLANF